MLYLICGENKFESEYKLNQIIKRSDKSQTKVLYLDENPNSVDELVIITQSQSLFKTQFSFKNIIIKGLEKSSKESLVKLESALSVTINDINIILYVNGNFDKRSRLYKFIKENGKLYEFKNKNTNELIDWIRKYCKENNCNLDHSFVIELAREYSQDQLGLKNELDKLILLNQVDSTIDKQKFMQVVNFKDFDIWTLIDNIFNNKAKALKILDNILLHYDFENIIALMVREFRLLALAKILHAKQNLVKMGIHPFVANKVISRSHNFSVSKIKTMYNKILDLEISIRNGKIEKRLAIDLLIIIF